MSTATKTPPTTEAPSSEASSPHALPPKRAGWFGKSLILLLICGGVVWFLPALIGQVASKTNVLALLGAKIPGEIEFDSASLSWEAPVLLHDVQVKGKDGQSMATIKSVTSKETLWELVSKPLQPLRLDLEGVSLEVVIPQQQIRPDAPLNPDAAIKPLLQHKFLKMPREIQIHVTDGELKLVDSERQPLTVLDHLEGTYVFAPAQAEKPAEHRVEFTSTVKEPATGGNSKLTAIWQDRSMGLPEGETALLPQDAEKVIAKLSLSRFPLNALEPPLLSVMPEKKLRGTISGECEIACGQLSSGDIQASVKGSAREPVDLAPDQRAQLISLDGASTPFSLGEVSWNVAGEYLAESDQLQVATLEFLSAPLTIQGKGRVHELHQRAVVDVQGILKCDAQELLVHLPTELRQELSADGLRVTSFRALGPARQLDVTTGDSTPLELAETLQLSATLGWDRLSAFGVESTAGELRTTLSNGWLVLDPVSVAVGKGHVKSLPQVELHDEPHFEIPKGVMLEKVHLTEPLVRKWLKYPAPLLANSTSIDGMLSLEIAEVGKGQLGHMDQADIPGVIQIHQATIAPGPLVREIQDLIDQISAMTGGRAIPRERVKVTMVEQTLPFRVMEGRVFHKDFHLDIGDVRIGTSGSVGLDQTLDMVMTIPLNEKWLQKGPILQSLQGEVITVNIRGTLDEPRIDARPLADFGKRIGIKAAGGLIEKLLQNPPPRLRRPRPLP